jgi:endonuclease YncB( thermonuclease family)
VAEGRTWTYPVKTDHTGKPVVIEVHDGDTVRLLCDAGGDAGIFPWLRLSRAGAPELNQPGGPEATDWIRQRLTSAEQIQVTIHGRSFARWLASITVDGVDLADEMVAAGHATYR